MHHELKITGTTKPWHPRAAAAKAKRPAHSHDDPSHFEADPPTLTKIEMAGPEKFGAVVSPLYREALSSGDTLAYFSIDGRHKVEGIITSVGVLDDDGGTSITFDRTALLRWPPKPEVAVG